MRNVKFVFMGVALMLLPFVLKAQTNYSWTYYENGQALYTGKIKNISTIQKAKSEIISELGNLVKCKEVDLIQRSTAKRDIKRCYILISNKKRSAKNESSSITID